MKLVEALPQTKIQDLKCAPPPCTCQRWQADQRRQAPTLVARRNIAALFGSLGYNELGPDAGAALAEGLKGNGTLAELKCALPIAK